MTMARIASHPRFARWLTLALACAITGCEADGIADRSEAAAPASADAATADATAAPPARADAAVVSGADAAAPATLPDAATPPTTTDAGDAGSIPPDASVGAGTDAQAPRDAQVAPPQSCPSMAGLSAGDHKEMLQHGGRARSYLVHVPSGADGTKPLPLVVDFHGYSRTSSSQKSGSGWDRLADRVGVVAVYPDGIGNSWNVGGCCGSAGSGNVDDVGFVRALVAKLATQLCIDSKRVYASGVSNGAGMSARIGCDAADVFAGVALVSSDLRTKPCTPARPVTEIAFRGTADTLEPYEGGLVGPAGMQFDSPGARGSFELWKNLNQCSGTPVTTAKLCETYSQCSGGVEVTLCTLPGVGHSPYENNLDFDIAQVTWDAFQRVPPR